MIRTRKRGLLDFFKNSGWQSHRRAALRGKHLQQVAVDVQGDGAAPHARSSSTQSQDRSLLSILSARGRSRRSVGRDRARFSPIENDAAEIERSITSFAGVSNGGLIIGPDTTNTLQRAQIIALAARHHLPAIYSNRLFVVDGGLISYSTDRVDQFRQGATYVDRILRGAKPADLPVEAPTKYETTLNLKTAKALGLDVPDKLLVAADEVIE
jgi:hypothetical protein